MKKIRIGNDFVFNWAIERGGLPEDLSSVLEKHLHLSVFGKRVELIEDVDYGITGNVIRIEVTPAIANIIGTYKAEFHYILPDNGLIDEDRKCAVDVDAFQIVAKTAQADDSSEFSVTSDMAIAFKGDKGDSAYQVWLDAGNIGTEEDYFAYLRQPAVDAGASISELEGEIQVSEGLRISAESERDLAETARNTAENERLSAEIIRQSNEDNRIDNEETRVQSEAERISKENIRQSNEIDRVEAEGERVQAENERVQAEVERQATIQEAVIATNLANEKANLANVAAQSANEAADSALTATQEATTAASLADTARLAIQDDLALKANQTDLEQLESEVEQLADNTSVKIKNLVINGDFNSSEGWTTTRQGTIVDGELVTTTLSNPPWSQSINASIGDMVYFGGVCYTLSGAGSYNTPSIRFKDSNSSTVVSNPTEIPTRVSGIRTIAGDGIAIILNLQASGAVNHHFDKIFAINLTETFGKGSEPTKEEFELLLATLGIDYFEGEITIPAQKVMQWQLKMIRQNRNAIIALGGTII